MIRFHRGEEAVGVARMLLAVCVAVLAAGCSDGNPVGPIPLNEPFTLAPGESAAVRGASLRVTFLRVGGDSRCPADAFCIHAGDASVLVRISDGAARDHDLHTGDLARASTTQGGFRITLDELQPYPFSSRPIAPGEYRATLSVARE